ncbi:unnamed protein product [Boreogadus saida]
MWKPLNAKIARDEREEEPDADTPGADQLPRTRPSRARSNRHMMMLKMGSLFLILYGLGQIPLAQGQITRKDETMEQPGITPRREIDTLVHIARRVQGHALPDQSVTLNTLSSPFEINGGIAPTGG